MSLDFLGIGLGAAPWTRVRGRNMVAVLGDSLAASLHLDAGTFNNLNPRHPLNWANGLSGGRLQLVSSQNGNFGVSGERTDQIMARVPAVINSGAGLVWLIAGTNDVAQAYPSSTTSGATAFQNIQTMVNSFVSNGLTVIIELMVGATNLTTTQLVQMNDLNQRLIQYYNNKPMVYLHDSSKMLLNPIGSTSAITQKTNYFYDTTHPSALGGYYWGKSLANLIQFMVPPYPRTPHLNLTDAQNTAYLTNPFFVTQTGGSSGGGVISSGTSPSSWNITRSAGTLTQTVAVTYGTDDTATLDPSIGNKIIMTYTFAGAGDRINIGQDLTSGQWTPGMGFNASVRTRVISGASNLASARLNVTSSVDSVVVNYYSMIEPSSTEYNADENYTFDHTISNRTLSSGTTGTTKNFAGLYIQVVGRAAGTATVEISRPSFRKIY